MGDPNKVNSQAETQEKTLIDNFATTRQPQDPILGTMLANRYRIQRKLGHGGFGVVYLATDEKMLSRPVVVKALHDEGLEHEWSTRKFKQEIEALARIDHPSIVGLFDVGEMPDGKPFIVMQYVDGFSLRSLITPEGLDFWRAANILRQTGRALSAAHDRGILHRDLKPENIMVQSLGGGDEQVKIIDFGIARVKNSVVSFTTASEKTVGTIAYMSPEQLIAGQLTPASDVYCLAVIAYELLTGRRPANPESAYQLLEMQRAGVRIRPTDLRPGLPQQAETIILKGLSFEPEKRHQRARDFGDFLATALTEAQVIVPVEEHSQITELSPEVKGVSVPEAAHVLFIEVIGFADLMADEQPAYLQKLQNVVNRTEDFNRVQSTDKLIKLPTGNGMALVFFDDPEAPLRCALDISHGLKTCPEVRVRMGVHSGLVYRLADINTNMNVAGGGLIVAQRIMELGDPGHILVSQRVADDLMQMARWSPCFQDLGEAGLKNGARVHVFNLYTEDVGNERIPAKLRPAKAPTNFKRIGAIAAVTLIVGLLGVVFALMVIRRGAATIASTVAADIPASAEPVFKYWLTVQKMRNNKPDGGEIEMTGREIYGNGWKFRFNLIPIKKGALYLLNETQIADGQPEFNALFPTPQNGGQAVLEGDQRLQTDWYVFDENTGTEKLWMIWRPSATAELDEVFREAARRDGVLNNTEIAVVRKYLRQYESQRPTLITDKTLSLVKGQGNTIVNLQELEHKAY